MKCINIQCEDSVLYKLNENVWICEECGQEMEEEGASAIETTE